MTSNIPLCDLLLDVCHECEISPTGPAQEKDRPSSQLQKTQNSSGGSAHQLGQSMALAKLRESALRPFHFTRLDLQIIAALFQQHSLNERPVSIIRLLRSVTRKKTASMVHASQVLRLAYDGILTMHKPGLLGSLPIGMLYACNNLEEEILQGYEVSLSKPFLAFLIDEQRPVPIEEGFKTNKEFIKEAFRCCLAAQTYFNVPKGQWRIDLFDLRLDERYANLNDRLNRTSIEIPFRDLIQEYNLDRDEQLTLLYLVERESLRWTTEVTQVSRIIEPDQFQRDKIDAVLSPDGTLKRFGFIETGEMRTMQGSRDTLNIERGLFSYIAADGQPMARSSVSEVCRKNPAISISKPVKTFDQIVLPEKQMGMLSSVIQSFRTDNHSLLKKWGVVEDDTRDDTHSETRRTIVLLFGRPGVGKTMAAEVIAEALNKELMRVDISQIQDRYVGESEKNLRSVFSSYEECLQKSPNPPVLFLNECDQFLSKRIENVRQSTDQMLNTMQNMLLEFLENFSGICIATTNLATNLDPAFSRRFTHKIELPWPDLSTRERLWDKFIPPSLPLSADINVQALAEGYSFSGSQIQTVILNAAQDAASRHPRQQVVDLSDIIKYADLEHSGSFDDSNTKRIGFDQSIRSK